MKVIELAKKLKVREIYIHSVMRDLSSKEGIEFTKKGKSYDLTDEQVQIIMKEIQRRKGLMNE